MTKKLIVTSLNQIKLDAVKEVFGTDYDIIGVESNSEIPEQPYGGGETLRGALNRIESIENHFETPDLVISIENGIVPIGIEFIDMAVIVGLFPKTGAHFTVTSPGIHIEDIELVKKAVFEEKQEVTVGKLLADKYGTNPKDPHSYLTKGISRQDILIQTLKILKGTMS